jgi:hypothetical protein
MSIEPGLLIIFLAVLAGIAVMLGLAVVWLLRRQLKLNRECEALSEFVHTVHSELRDLHSTALAMEERMLAAELRSNALNDQFEGLAERIKDVHQDDTPANHPYSQAIQKVRRGASVSELMQNSGLSQDEAALLIRLHGAKAP